MSDQAGNPASPGTVLVLEDDEGVRLLQRRALERAGFKVADAATITEARRLIDAHPPDLLVLDYQLSDGENGLEFYRALQEEGRDYPAILVTGVSDEARILEAMRAGVRDFLPKTPNFVELTAPTVQRVMRQVHQERKLAAAEAASHAKDQFLATLSHELRTPLTPVLAIISELRTDARLPEEVRSDLDTVYRNIRLESRLIDDLLDLTRVVRGKLELELRPVDLRSILEHASEAVGRSEIHRRKLALEFDFAPIEHPVLGDSARLTQVFWNLLQNSIKFTPEDGRIRIRSREETVDGRAWLCVEVEDSGMGIDPATLPRVFDAFEQGTRAVTRAFGGLGLGLAISRSIVEAHGGTLSAASEGHGRGATFTVRLPLDRTGTKPAEIPSAAGPAEDGSFAGASLLLVEDHPDSARLLTRMLRRAGFQVAQADSVASARAVLEGLEAGEGRMSSRLQLVISDVGLPDGTGFELMSEIRDRFDLPGIALSGYGMEDDVGRAHEAGFARHLTKPVELQNLLDAIRETLSENAEMNPDVREAIHR